MRGTDPVFVKTSQNARFLLSENERFGLVFVKTGSINSGTDVFNLRSFDLSRGLGLPPLYSVSFSSMYRNSQHRSLIAISQNKAFSHSLFYTRDTVHVSGGQTS